MVEESRARALEADLARNRLQLFVNRRDLLQSELVDLVGGKVGGGRAFEQVGIIGRAVGQMPRAEVARRLRLDLVDRGDQRVIAMLERAGQRGARVRQKPGLAVRKSDVSGKGGSVSGTLVVVGYIIKKKIKK